MSFPFEKPVFNLGPNCWLWTPIKSYLLMRLCKFGNWIHILVFSTAPWELKLSTRSMHIKHWIKLLQHPVTYIGITRTLDTTVTFWMCSSTIRWSNAQCVLDNSKVYDEERVARYITISLWLSKMHRKMSQLYCSIIYRLNT